MVAKSNLVRRKRPQQQTVNNNSNDPRVQLPASRRRQNVPTSATSEVINRRLPIRGQPQNTNNQFSNFQPQPFAAQPFQVPANRFDGHPAQNIDLNTGSYTI